MTALPASAQGPGPSLPGTMGQPPLPTIPDDQKADLLKAATSPTWEDVTAILRSDKMRGYRIDIETDSTVLQDAQADKQSRIEFMGAAKDFLQQAYQAITVAPQLLPVVQEVMMFGVRSFKAGRALEETFEDAFDELSKNPPKPPAGPQQPGPDPVAMAKVDVEKQRLLFDFQALQKDNETKANETAAQQTERNLKIQADIAAIQRDREKNSVDAALKNRALDLQGKELALKADGQQKDILLRTAAHNKSLVDEATATASGQAPDGARAGPTHLEQLMTQLAQVVVQGHESLAQAQNQLTQAFMQAQKDNAAALSQSHQMHAAQMADLGKRLTAPRKVIRGPDGRAMGVETVG